MKRRAFLQNNAVLLALAPLAGARRPLRLRRSRSGLREPRTRSAERPQPYVVAGSAGWWEKEPLLIYEVIMFTVPGYSVSNNWQQNADPAVEAGDVAAAHALQTHQTSIIPGHLTNRFCYFKSPQFKENRRDYLAAYLEESKTAGFRTIVYFNVHAVKPEFGAEQPDWRQVRFDGNASRRYLRRRDELLRQLALARLGARCLSRPVPVPHRRHFLRRTLPLCQLLLLRSLSQAL